MQRNFNSWRNKDKGSRFMKRIASNRIASYPTVGKFLHTHIHAENRVLLFRRSRSKNAYVCQARIRGKWLRRGGNSRRKHFQLHGDTKKYYFLTSYCSTGVLKLVAFVKIKGKQPFVWCRVIARRRRSLVARFFSLSFFPLDVWKRARKHRVNFAAALVGKLCCKRVRLVIRVFARSILSRFHHTRT